MVWCRCWAVHPSLRIGHAPPLSQRCWLGVFQLTDRACPPFLGSIGPHSGWFTLFPVKMWAHVRNWLRRVPRRNLEASLVTYHKPGLGAAGSGTGGLLSVILRDRSEGWLSQPCLCPNCWFYVVYLLSICLCG